MPSSPQSVATFVVFDYLLDTTGKALANRQVVITLEVAQANAITPLVNLAPLSVKVTTDQNGYWQASLISNTNINPANTVYTVQPPGVDAYQISVPGGPGPYQSSSIVVNAPAALSPATTSLTGPITVTGNQSVSGNVSIGGTLALTGAITTDVTTNGNVFIHGPDPWFDVRNFGATGNGSTDDTTAIQGAINAASTNGGTVYFPPGTYIASGLTFFGKVKYLGAGIENTILKLKNGANTFLLQSNNFASLTGGGTTGGEFNFSFEQMTVDGNKANNGSSTVPVVRIYGFGYKLNNFHERNGNNEGVYSEWSTSTSPLAPDSMECHWINVKVHDNGSHGVHWKGPHDSNWANVEVFSNGARGVFVDTGGSGLLATNCHSYGNSQTWAWYLGDTGVLCKNCVAEGASTGQVAIDANDCAFDGFIYAAGAATPVGLVIGPTASRSGYLVTAKINNCTSGTVAFTNDGGGIIYATGFQIGGTVTTGTISNLSRIDLRMDGVAGSVYRFPNAVSIAPASGTAPATSSYGSVPVKFFETSGAQASPISIGSIPGTFRKIRIGFKLRSTLAATTEAMTITFNGDTTAADYEGNQLSGSGATATSATITNGITILPAASATAGLFGTGWIEIYGYTDTVSRKGFTTQATLNNAGTMQQYLSTGEWVTSGTVITSVELRCTGFAAGSLVTVELYP